MTKVTKTVAAIDSNTIKSRIHIVTDEVQAAKRLRDYAGFTWAADVISLCLNVSYQPEGLTFKWLEALRCKVSSQRRQRVPDW